ncbi:MAG: NAD(+) diphosphatase [Thermoanaerobaculia bacterium]
MKPPNVYSNQIDRAAHHRKDASWIASKLADPASQAIVLWNTSALVAPDASAIVALPLPEAVALSEPTSDVYFLGEREGTAWFAVDLSALQDPLADPALAGRGEMLELRKAAAVISASELSLLAYARALKNWHDHHHFCSVCGAPARVAEAGHLRECTSPECGTHHFPRTDPAVIVLVTDGDRCLLGRKAMWPPGMVSTLAGFVEPGESLEDAVRREIREESGIEVTDIHYHSSQPWPFPASLMVGFNARATTTEIIVDLEELEEARWFTRDELRERFSESPRFPGMDSIARRLIEEWIGRE